MPASRPACARALLAASLSTALAVGLSGCASAPAAPAATTTAGLTPDAISRIVAAPDRSAADRINDLRRKPEATLAFIAPQPGSVALDVSTGGGYTAELLARAIGPTGTVYGQSPPRIPGHEAPKPATPEGGAPPPGAAASAPPRRLTSAESLAEREKKLQAAGVAAAPLVYVAQPFDDPVPPALANGGLDLVTLMFNYHDFGFLGVDRAHMNSALFAALKPGGVYVIADHAGRPGTGITESDTLHRVEASFVRKEVEAAGFRFVAEGEFLHNPNDPRDRNTPEPPQPKDEFVLKFVKP